MNLDQRTSAWVRAQVAAAPPLSQEQAHQLPRFLSGLLNSTEHRDTATPATPKDLGMTA